MTRCSEAITESLRACKIGTDQLPRNKSRWISSVDMKPVSEGFDNMSYWHRNTVGCVFFSQALLYALQQHKFDLAVEIGAHPALKGPALQVVESTFGRTMPYTGILSRGIDDVQACSDGLGYMWANLSINTVDFAGYHKFLAVSPYSKFLKDTPSYPWDHQRPYWYESRISHAYRHRAAHHELLGIRTADYSQDRMAWKHYIVPKTLSWILGHRIQGQLVFPASGYVVAAFEAARLAISTQPIQLLEITELIFGQALTFRSEESCVETLVSLTGIQRQKSIITANFTFHSTDNSETGPMALNASGKLRMVLGSDTGGLSVRSQPHFGMTEVAHDQIYASLAKIGYEYSGPFKGLSSVQRRSGVAIGSIKKPECSSLLLLHPATLDVAMHSIAVASSYPGDGRLSSVVVPTEISKVSICPNQAEINRNNQELRFESFSTDDSNLTGGDVLVFPSTGVDAIFRLEGLQTKPMNADTPANDEHLFFDTIWGPESPVLKAGDLSEDQSDAERLSNADEQHIQDIAKQLSHRYPAMHILG